MTSETETLSNDTRAKLEEVFRAVFELPSGAPVQHIRQINFRKWDSLGHVLLIAAVESEFGRSIDPTKSLQLTSFESMELYLAENA